MRYLLLLELCILASLTSAADSIDSLVEQQWQRDGVTPSERCSDAVFLRRLSLDLVGRIPTTDELARFETNPDREAAIDRFLQSPRFARFWSELLASTLNGYSNAFNSDREVLRQWLESQIASEVSYDQIVTSLLTAREPSALSGPANFLIRYPQEPVIKATRIFLGVRLDCARCHDHPFDRWTEDDYQHMHRFFAATERQAVSEGNYRLIDRPIQVEPGDRPRFLTGAIPRTTQWRDEFALYTTRSKPFARAFANRVWYYLMGRGIVEPVDDFNTQNPPAVSGLIEFLADQTHAESFDLKSLVRTICRSDVYQLSSARSDRTTTEEATFAFRTLKPMTPEQLYDSLTTAFGMEPKPTERLQFIRRIVGQSLDEDYSQTWEYRETVGDLMQRLSGELPHVQLSPDAAYRRILSRSPTEQERELCQAVSSEDILFALVSSNEFYFNH